MEGLAVIFAFLICAVIFAIPIGVLIALNRTTRLSRQVEEQQRQSSAAISALKSDLSALSQALVNANEKITRLAQGLPVDLSSAQRPPTERGDAGMRFAVPAPVTERAAKPAPPPTKPAVEKAPPAVIRPATPAVPPSLTPPVVRPESPIEHIAAKPQAPLPPAPPVLPGEAKPAAAAQHAAPSVIPLNVPKPAPVVSSPVPPTDKPPAEIAPPVPPPVVPVAISTPLPVAQHIPVAQAAAPPVVAPKPVPAPVKPAEPFVPASPVAPVAPAAAAAIKSPAVPASSMPVPATASTRAYVPPAPPKVAPPRPPRKSFAERLRSTLALEERLGSNWFVKLGIAMVVIGLALWGISEREKLGPGGTDLLLYTISTGLLGGGIWIERNARYQLLGRLGIGGGWALLFFTTWGMYYVHPMHVVSSQTLDCVLMLVVAAAMLIHTLRYQSQLVTGFAFLLAFSTIALSTDTVYALTAGAILAAGIVIITMRKGWFELEVFGILASFLNHLYWLWKLHPHGFAGQAFPEFWPSVILLVLYWVAFRISYVARSPRTTLQEAVSSVAAILNTSLLLAVMKFQSTHPEWTFYALFALGAIEFGFGQLPATRRRRPAFILLSVLGVMLMLAAVPFKFSGNNIALLWMVAAEVLIFAGIAQKELVFRRLGLLTGLFTGVLIGYGAWHIVAQRIASEAPLREDGVLLVSASVLFYLNAHVVRHRWHDLFNAFDDNLATAHSYIGGVTAFLGCWAVFVNDWTALAWAVLMLASAAATSRLASRHLAAQCALLATATLVRTAMFNCHWGITYPTHVALRLVTLPLIALLLYLSSYLLMKLEGSAAQTLRTLMTWAGTALLVILSNLETARHWTPVVWILLAVLLFEAALRFSSGRLEAQSHVVSLLATLASFGSYDAEAVSMSWHGALVSIVPIALALYWIAFRSGKLTRPGAAVVRTIYTWGAASVIAYLIWREVPEDWVAVAWLAFGIALALLGRWRSVDSLCQQEHVLAVATVFQVAVFNLTSQAAWGAIPLRVITVTLVAAGLYGFSRRCAPRESEYGRYAAWMHTSAATGILVALVWFEAQSVWIAPIWAMFALALALYDRVFEAEELPWQAHAVAAFATIRAIQFNLLTDDRWHNFSLRLITVCVVAASMYLLARYVRLPEQFRRVRWAYTLAGTGLLTALVWFEARSIWIAPIWALFALALAVIDRYFDIEDLRWQAHALAALAAIRAIQFNLLTDDRWHNFSLRLITICVVAASMYLLARYLRLPERFHRVRWAYTFAGTGLLTALVWYETQAVWISPVWALFALALALIDRYFEVEDLRWQSHILAALAAARTIQFNLISDDQWHNVSLRLITVCVVAASMYLLARYLRLPEQFRRIRWAYTFTGTGLLTALVWFEAQSVWIAPIWALFALALALIDRCFDIEDLRLQAHALAVLAAMRAVEFNLAAEDRWHNLSLRLITVSIVAASMYLLAHYVRLPEQFRRVRWAYTFAGAGLLNALVWFEAQSVWVAPLWILFALALTFYDRYFEVEELPWQAHLLAALATIRTIQFNLFAPEKWNHLSLRLVTVSIMVVSLYLLARYVRMPERLRQQGSQHAYTWIASGIAGWLIWSELDPIAVAIGVGLFGLVLFECGMMQKQAQLRWQSYVALAASFGRIFFVNLTAKPLEGEWIGPRLFTVLPLAAIYFLAWSQLQPNKGDPEIERWSASTMLAYFGSGSIIAMLYFQVSPEWVAPAWALVAMALLTAALLLEQGVFLHQATQLVVALVVRGLTHNLYGGSYFSQGGWRGNMAIILLTAAILLASLPIAFRLRGRFGDSHSASRIRRIFFVAVGHPEQVFFFAAILLITLAIEVKMNPGMVTLCWGVEGVLVFLLALVARQRSYRLTGMALLVLCVGKVAFRDMWRFTGSDRYLTIIGLGAAFVLVGFLWMRYKESIRQFL